MLFPFPCAGFLITAFSFTFNWLTALPYAVTLCCTSGASFLIISSSSSSHLAVLPSLQNANCICRLCKAALPARTNCGRFSQSATTSTIAIQSDSCWKKASNRFPPGWFATVETYLVSIRSASHSPLPAAISVEHCNTWMASIGSPRSSWLCGC